MKVLFLASYFPKPGNPVMGTWALSQAQALARQPIELRVLSFTSWVPSVLAGSARAKAYAECPASYTWRGNVHVVYPRWGYYPVEPLRSWSYRYPWPYLEFGFRTARKRLIYEIETFRPDVIFCHHSLPNGWMVSRLPEKYRKPMFVLEHGFKEISDCGHLPQRRAAFLEALSATTCLLAVSEPMAEIMRRVFPGQRILTHHNGIDIQKFPEKLTRPPELRGKFVFLACAIFYEQKGIPLLVRAFGSIAKQYPNAILRIIGGGKEEDLVRKTIAKLKVGAQVQLLGKKSHDVVLREMHMADCFALVGWEEPFATVYLEAMAAKQPIICCSDGGITDVVSHGKEAFIVPPKDEEAVVDALTFMLDNPDKAREMGINGHYLIESSLTWDAKTRQLLKLFKEALQK